MKNNRLLAAYVCYYTNDPLHKLGQVSHDIALNVQRVADTVSHDVKLNIQRAADAISHDVKLNIVWPDQAVIHDITLIIREAATSSN